MTDIDRKPAVPTQVVRPEDVVDEVEEQGNMGEMEAVGIVDDKLTSDFREQRVKESLDELISVPKFDSVEMTMAERLQEMLAMMGQAGD